MLGRGASSQKQLQSFSPGHRFHFIREPSWWLRCGDGLKGLRLEAGGELGDSADLGEPELRWWLEEWGKGNSEAVSRLLKDGLLLLLLLLLLSRFSRVQLCATP